MLSRLVKCVFDSFYHSFFHVRDYGTVKRIEPGRCLLNGAMKKILGDLLCDVGLCRNIIGRRVIDYSVEIISPL